MFPIRIILKQGGAKIPPLIIMNKIFFFILTLISINSFGQSNLYLRGDTTHIIRDGGNANLNIYNATRTRTGAFLKNTGGGRTNFSYALDSVWVDGDSLRFRYGTTTLAVAFSSVETDPNAILKTGITTLGGNVTVRGLNNTRSFTFDSLLAFNVRANGTGTPVSITTNNGTATGSFYTTNFGGNSVGAAMYAGGNSASYYGLPIFSVSAPDSTAQVRAGTLEILTDSSDVNRGIFIPELPYASDLTNKGTIYHDSVTKKLYRGPNGSGGGSGVTSVESGYGLLGGPITTTGTLLVDSLVIATKLFVQHLIDSLAGESALDETFANANLTATGDRTHNFADNFLKLQSVSEFEINKNIASSTSHFEVSDDKANGFYIGGIYDANDYGLAGATAGNGISSGYLEANNATGYNRFSTFGDSSHTPKKISYTTNLHSTFNRYSLVDVAWVDSLHALLALASHTHAASDIVSGTIATARLGSGTANSTKVLAGDQTWKSAVTIDLTGGANGYEVYVENISTGALATRAATGGSVTPTGWLSFQVDVTTNAPEDGDNLLQNDSLVGKRIEVYREGLLQDSSASEGYTFNSGSGEITFIPALAANQRIKIHVYDEESIYDIALEVPPPPGYNSFDFTIKDGTLTESPTDVWNGTGSYGNNGLAPVKLPASTDGSVRMQYTSGSEDNVFGFIPTYALTNSGSFDAAVFINSGTIYRQDGGSSASTGISISVGDYLKVYRAGSTYKAAKSPDGTSWADVYTYTHSGSGVQFVGCDVSGKLSFPAEEGLIAAAGDDYASGTTALTFPTNTNQTNTSGVITASGSGYGQTGLSGSTLAASTDGWIGFKYSGTDAGDAVLGFNTTNAQEGLADFEACFFILAGGTPTIYYRDNGGGSTSTGVQAVFGDWIRMIRTGSTIKLQRSQDATSWTDLHTFSFSSSATLYIGSDFNAPSAKMYYPQKQ